MSIKSPSTSEDRDRRLEAVLAALLAAEDTGQSPDLDGLSIQYPGFAHELLAFFREHQRLGHLAAPVTATAKAAELRTAAEPRTAALPDPPGRLGVTFDTTAGPETTADAASVLNDPDATSPDTLEVSVDLELLADGTKVRYFGDYELSEVLGRGGMGVVYRARQLSLNRPVALKMLQAGTLASDDDLRRFQNEAEAVALLDHTHIVPILEVGRHEERRYFSMKLIDGPSLDKKLGDYSADPLAAARLLAKVAEAVHHAHQRGILHRDLKPSNILLDERGQPHVTDFGLAKRVQGDSELTQSGAILGTPAYMAPEQASGKRGAVTTATDVYGLGAILYALLTGRAPFGGESVVETLEKVRDQAPESPRKRNPEVPRDLEVICLKCLEKEPARRYASAQRLADDLRRFFGGEPIQARTIGAATRAWMWCKRKPVLAGLVSALAFVLLVSGIVVNIVDGARRREEEVRTQAETSFRIAREALEEYLTNVSENTLLKEQDSPDIRRLRQELLTSALRYYEKLVSQRSNDPRFREQRSHDPELGEQLARAYYRIGEITQVVGPAREALSAFHSAVELWEPLVAANPDNLEFKARLADSYVAISKLKKIDSLQEALRLLQLARQIREDLASHEPLDAGFSASLAECDSEIGDCNARLDQTSKALEFLQMARDRQEKLVARFPNQTGYKKSLAAIINRVGYVDYQRKDYSAALLTFREFQKLCLELLEQVNDGPKPLDLQNLLAYSYFNIALTYMAQGETQSALDSYEEARKQWSRMVGTHPSVRKFQADLGTVYIVMGSLLHQVKRNEQALLLLRKGVDIFQSLKNLEPENVGPHIELGRAWNTIGFLHDELRQNEQAIDDFRNAIDEHRFVLLHSPDQDEIKKALWLELANLGEQFVDLGRVDEGLPYYLEAVGVRRELVAAHADNLDDALALVKLLGWIGDIERLDGRPADAMEFYHEARVILESRQDKAPASASLRAKLTEYSDREAKTLIDLNRLEEARTLLEQDAKLRSSQNPTPGGIADRESVSEALWDYARILRIDGKKEEADRMDHERESLWDREAADKLVAFAATLAGRANLIGYGKKPTSAAGEVARKFDRDQAAATLHLALSFGYNDVSKITDNPDLGAIVEREDIKPLIMDLAFPQNPFVENR